MTRLKGFLGTNGRVGWPYQSRVNFGLEKVYAPPSWVRELHNKWFNVLLKGTSASKVANSVAAAHAAGRPPPCTTLLCAEALMPCSMKVNEKRNSWIEKAADLWSTGAVFCLDLCVWRGGGGFAPQLVTLPVLTTVTVTYSNTFDSSRHPPFVKAN